MTEETSDLLPRHTPQPTYSPFLVSVAIGIMGWGLVTNYVLSLFGILFLVFAVICWIRDILSDWHSTQTD